MHLTSTTTATRRLRSAYRLALRLGGPPLFTLFVSSRALAEEPLPLRIELASTAPCRPEALEEELRALVRRSFAIDERATTRLTVSVSQAGSASIHAHASFAGRAGEDSRDVEGRTCSELFQSVALVASTWIEAEPAVPPPAPPPLRSPPRRPAPFDPNDPVWKLSWERERAGARPVTSLGGHLVGYSGLSDRVALGADVAVAHRWGADRHELRGALRGVFSNQTRGGVDTGYVLVEAVVDGCENVLRGRLTLGPCVRIDPGVVHVSAGEQNHLLPWLGLAAGGRVAVRAGKAMLELEVFGGSPVTGYRIDRGESTLVPFRTLTVTAGAGVTFPIL